MCYCSRFGQPCTWSARDTSGLVCAHKSYRCRWVNAPFNATIIFESRRSTQNWDGEFFLSSLFARINYREERRRKTKKSCLRLFKIVDKTDRIFTTADTTHVGEIPWESGGARWFHCVKRLTDVIYSPSISWTLFIFSWRWGGRGDAPTIHHLATVLSFSTSSHCHTLDIYSKTIITRASW